MDKYKPMKILGEGSFGKVYLMRHIQKRELCCLKVMKIKKLSKSERENCKNEVQLMKQVSGVFFFDNISTGVSLVAFI